jgi:hypothetical protein
VYVNFSLSFFFFHLNVLPPPINSLSTSNQLQHTTTTAWKYFDKRPAMVARNQKTFENLFRDYNLHAHIYQCRNLTPVLSDGLTNAYVTVAVGGKNAYKDDVLKELYDQEEETKGEDSEKPDPKLLEDLAGTSVVEEEINPTFYEKLETTRVKLPCLTTLYEERKKNNMDVGDINGRRNKGLARNIVISVYHAASGKDKKGTKRLIGRAFFPPWRCHGEENMFKNGPRWLQLLPPESLNRGEVPSVFNHDGGSGFGQYTDRKRPSYILVRLGFNDYIQKDRDLIKNLDLKKYPAAAEWEISKRRGNKWLHRCRIKLGIFRLRNLVMSYWGGMRNPTIQITAPKPANDDVLDRETYVTLTLSLSLSLFLSS